MYALLSEDDGLDGLFHSLLELLHRLGLPLRDQLRHARCELQQFEELPERGQVPFFWSLDVLEVEQILQRGGHQRV